MWGSAIRLEGDVSISQPPGPDGPPYEVSYSALNQPLAPDNKMTRESLAPKMKLLGTKWI